MSQLRNEYSLNQAVNPSFPNKLSIATHCLPHLSKYLSTTLFKVSNLTLLCSARASTRSVHSLALCCTSVGHRSYLFPYPLLDSSPSQRQIVLKNREVDCTSSSRCTRNAFSQGNHAQAPWVPSSDDHIHSSVLYDFRKLDRHKLTSSRSIY